MDLVAILVPIACGCVLPIMIVWLTIRKEMNETNTRTQIVLAAIEKNPDMDLEEMMKKISPKKKLLKEKLLSKMQWGSITTMLGLGLIGFGIYLNVNGIGGKDDPMTSICGGLVLLGVGIALLINYVVGKRMLAKEIVAEENKMLTQP